MSIHDGHRNRLKKRYLASGAAGMNEHEALELILTYAIPRRDVNPLAHRLIARYGSLRAVLTERVGALVRNEGVSTHTAVLLKLMGDAMEQKLCTAERISTRSIKNVGDAARVCGELLCRGSREGFCVVLLDSKGMAVDSYAEGGESGAVGFDVRKLVGRALDSNAESAVIGHTHVISDKTCSETDMRLTRRAAAVLGEINVKLAEHVIVDSTGCYAILHDAFISAEGDGERAEACEESLAG